jgi:6-phosphogluconolactonase
MLNLKTFQTETEWIKESANRIAEFLVHYQKTQSTVRLALSGGSTPASVYEALSQKKEIDWSRVEVFIVDERYVPLENPKSNAKMITDSLISKVTTNFYPWDTSLSTEEALANYTDLISKREEPYFDIIILGIGEDGHTASLFPGDKLLLESEKLVGHSQTQVHDIKDRLTLTFPSITSSKNILILLKGEKKKAVIQELESGSKEKQQYPAKFISNLEQTEIIFTNGDTKPKNFIT